MDEFGLTWVQSEGMDTYRRSGGYRSILDHWFVRSNTLESGRCGLYRSRWYSAKWKAEHARLRLHISYLHSTNEGVRAKALPAAAIHRGMKNFSLPVIYIQSDDIENNNSL